MSIDYNALPIQPPAPLPDNATDAQRAAWLDQHRICASYAHGAAQQATADAMNNAADAQRALIDAMNASQPFNEVAVATQIAAALAVGPMTPDQIAKRAAGLAKQLAQEFPT